MYVLKAALIMLVTLACGVGAGYAYGEWKPPQFIAVNGHPPAIAALPQPQPHLVTDSLLSVPMSVVMEQRAARRAKTQPRPQVFVDPNTAALDAEIDRELRAATRLAAETPPPIPDEADAPAPAPPPPAGTPPPLGSAATQLSGVQPQLDVTAPPLTPANPSAQANPPAQADPATTTATAPPDVRPAAVVPDH